MNKLHRYCKKAPVHPIDPGHTLFTNISVDLVGPLLKSFVADFIKGFYAICGIKGTLSTAYHPRTDGQSERAIQELEIHLWCFMNDEQDDWVDWISLAKYAFNDKPNTSTGVTPHYATLGLHPAKGYPSVMHDPDR